MGCLSNISHLQMVQNLSAHGQSLMRSYYAYLTPSALATSPILILKFGFLKFVSKALNNPATQGLRLWNSHYAITVSVRAAPMVSEFKSTVC